MSDLLVYTYKDEKKATEVLSEISAMKQENIQRPLLGIDDAAVVVKNENGKVKVKQTLESMVKGNKMVSGSFWGLLAGFLFGGPLFGGLIGLGLSALLGRSIDIGIDNEFIEEISDDLSPGDSALFLLIGSTPVDTISMALKDFGGSLYHTSFSNEDMLIFEQASETKAVVNMLEAEQIA